MFASLVSLLTITVFLLPCSKEKHLLYVSVQRSDKQLGANAYGKGTR